MLVQRQDSARKQHGSNIEAKVSQKQLMAKLWREMERPGNQNCADCGQSDPEWASINFGILLCTQCASVHRSLGVNVSVVRSITLDQWDNSQLVNIQNLGNRASNEIYEYSLPAGVKPNMSSSITSRAKFIRSKYIEKAYVKRGEDKSVNRLRRKPSASVVSQESAIPLRLVDYFVVLGRGSHLTGLKFEAKIVDRLPVHDHNDFPLPPNSLEPFVFPEDITLSSIHLPPTRVGFTLTSAIGTRQYVVGLVFWEILTPMEIVEMQVSYSDREPGKNSKLLFDAHDGSNLADRSLFSPKCILVVSHWPFLNVFEKWISMIYRISLSSAPLPIERYISNFVFEVPVPPPGKVAVQFSVADQTLRISRPPPNQLPLCDCRMMTLFQCLDLNNVIALITAMLTEQKIVLCSSQQSVLLDVCEAACALIFPLSWQGVYMPVLPRKLSEFIHAPVPFIAGIKSSYLQQPNPISIPIEVILFDLDANRVDMPAQDSLPVLPEKPLKKLLDSLRPLVSGLLFNGRDDIDLAFPFSDQLMPIEKFGEAGLIVSDSAPSPVATRTVSTKQILSRLKRGSPVKPSLSGNFDSGPTFDIDSVRELFLRFMVKVLGKYRQYLIPSDQSRADLDSSSDDENHARSLFDRNSFLREAPDSFRPLLAILSETQMFERFIRDRWTPACTANDSKAPPEVLFFDDCIVAKMNRSNFHLHRSTPFLDDRSNDITTTFVSPFPNQAGISDDAFDYAHFPQLQLDRVGPLRAVEPLVSKERRQMVSTLARRVNTELMKGRIVPQFQSWDRLRKAAIVIQKYYRGYNPRKVYKNLKRVARFMDDRVSYLKLRFATLLVQAGFRLYLTRAHRTLLQFASASTVISSALSAYLAMKHLERKLTAVLQLQAMLSSLVAISRSRYLLSIYIRIQAKVRMQLERRRFIRTVALIIKTQAHFRAIRVRRHQACVIQEGIRSCRTKLVELWSVLHSPLNYRSQFWVILEKPSYLSWMLHIEEVHKLQNDLKTRSAEANKRAKEMLVFERRQLYNTLAKLVPKAIREEFFSQFGLKGGHRKKRLSETIWTEQGKEQLSSDAVLSIVSKIGNVDLHIVEANKRERIRLNLLRTTISSLKAVSHLQLRTALLKAQAKAAATASAHLSIRHQVLLQQARAVLNQSKRESASRRNSLTLRQGYCPRYDEAR